METGAKKVACDVTWFAIVHMHLHLFTGMGHGPSSP